MQSDVDVANAARMSLMLRIVSGLTKSDEAPNQYLMRNKHMTPFESIEVWREMKLPIFVARQFVR